MATLMNIYGLANEVSELLDHDSLCAAIRAGDWPVATAAKRSAWFVAATVEHERQTREARGRFKHEFRCPTIRELTLIACMRFYKAHPNAAGAGWPAVMAAYMREIGEIVPFRCVLHKETTLLVLCLEFHEHWHIRLEDICGESDDDPSDQTFDTLEEIARVLETMAKFPGVMSSTLVA